MDGVWCMWNEFLNKKIRVTKTDGYIKYGILTGIEDNFIFLKYDDFRTVTIQKTDISHIELFVGVNKDAN